MILGVVVPTHRVADLLDGGGNAHDNGVGFCIGRARERHGIRVVFAASADGKAFPVRVHQKLHVRRVVEVGCRVHVELELVAVHGQECFGFAADEFDDLKVL